VVSRDLDDDDFSIDVYNDGGANCGTGVFHADDGAVLSPSYAVGGTPAIFLRATRARRCFSTARDQALPRRATEPYFLYGDGARRRQRAGIER